MVNNFKQAFEFDKDILRLHDDFKILQSKLTNELLPLFKTITKRIRALIEFGGDADGNDLERITIEIHLLVMAIEPFEKEYLNSAPSDIKKVFDTFSGLEMKPEFIKKYLSEFKYGKDNK